MPISRREFEKGRTQDTIKARLEKLFDSGDAYTLRELGKQLYGKRRGFGEALLMGVVEAFFIKRVLEDLIEEGLVETREVETWRGTEVYYAKKQLS